MLAKDKPPRKGRRCNELGSFATSDELKFLAPGQCTRQEFRK
jgi:hypothetical protein